jgi:glycerate-2-kinase
MGEDPRPRRRRDAQAILEAGVEAADAEALTRAALRSEGRWEGPDGDELRLAAVGKAAPAMARALAAAFPEAPGILAAPRDALDRAGGVPPGWEAVVGGHPLPNGGSLDAGEALLAAARAVPEEGRFLAAVSGGGSACAEAPRVPLEDLRAVTGALMEAGLKVGAVNAVRRGLSNLKSGGLARACAGGVRGYVLSDVVGDRLADVASGPTVPVEAPRAAGRRVLEEASLWEVAPASVRAALGEGDGEGAEPAGDVENVLVGGNGEGAAGAAAAARERGYAVARRGDAFEGPAREVGRALVRHAREEAEVAEASEGGLTLVAGGEATAAAEGSGRGGPCQEAALAAATAMRGQEGVVGVVDTDGVDGPTDAAGAVVDGGTVRRGEAAGLEADAALSGHNAYPFLEAAGDLVRWGPTGTNVNDLAVVLVPED